jgi:guanylate kinase
VRPFLLVLSSPSGGGKSSIAKALLARGDVGYSVSATTRAMRAGEREGVDYHFLSREEFLGRVAVGEFVEHAEYNGNLYGTLKAEVRKLFDRGTHALLDIEIEGARQVRASFPNAVFVFVLPPTGETLVARLAGRGTESDEVIRARLAVAAEELLAVGEYDYVVVNDDLEDAVDQVASIVTAESRRVTRQADLDARIEELRRAIAAQAATYARPDAGPERSKRE